MTRLKNGHGGDWASYEIEYGNTPLDFSMNVNPLGISERVQAAIAEAASSADRYPDPKCRQLRGAIAKAEGVAAERIFCGAGAADIIYRLAKTAKKDEEPRLLITAPTFSEYEGAFASEGWRVERWLLREDEGFAVGEDLAEAIKATAKETDGGADVLFLCEPNNPTGVATDRKRLEEILDACKQAGTTFVIDECFNGFLDEPEAHTMKSYLDEYDNLIILKAFTKIYGMAGVRLGYCLCASQETAEALGKAGAPWNVSSLAQAAGIAALEDWTHAAKGVEIVQEERQWLKDALLWLGYSRVYGEANYLLFSGQKGLDEAMRKRGILIRNCDNYYGLGEGWFRIAVKKHEENQELIENLKCITETER